MADVFISYKREEIATARQVRLALMAAHYSVWWDEEVQGGQQWAEEIDRELAKAQVVVVLWSSSSTVSDWVKHEASVGKLRKRLVPAQIQTCNIPAAFASIQAFDLRGWDGNDKNHHFVGLRRSVRHKIWRQRFAAAILAACSTMAVVCAGFIGFGFGRTHASQTSTRIDGETLPPDASADALPAPEATLGTPRVTPSFTRIMYVDFEKATQPKQSSYDAWELGRHAPWAASIKNGRYTICNKTSPGEIAGHCFAPTHDNAFKKASIRIGLSGPNETDSGAGVMFRCNPDGSSFLAYVRNAEGRGELLLKRDHGIARIWSGSGFDENDSVPQALGIEDRGDEIDLYADNRLVHTISASELPEKLAWTDLDTGTGAGTVAYSTGCFSLDDFALYASPP